MLDLESELFGRTLRVSIAKPDKPKLGARKPGMHPLPALAHCFSLILMQLFLCVCVCGTTLLN